MHADLRTIPHESALFSRGCNLVSLRVVPCQVTAKVSAPQAPWGVPWFVAPQEISSWERGLKSHWFLCAFMGYFSEASMKTGRNSTTEKSGTIVGKYTLSVRQ